MKQVMVIGLGRFGMSLARSLAGRGAEVLAVDARDEPVRAATVFATEALCLDATDPEALARTAPARRDICICAIGDESIEASVLCTALLREMGGKRVVARASGELQARILKRVGAHDVVNPLQDFGERFASHLVYERILNEMPLGQDLVITELRPTADLIGKTLPQLNLPRRAGITVVAVRRVSEGSVRLPDPQAIIAADDVLIVVSRPDAVARLLERG